MNIQIFKSCDIHEYEYVILILLNIFINSHVTLSVSHITYIFYKLINLIYIKYYILLLKGLIK